MTHEHIEYEFPKTNRPTFLKSEFKTKLRTKNTIALHRPIQAPLNYTKQQLAYGGQFGHMDMPLDSSTVATAFVSPRTTRLKRLVDVTGAGAAIVLLSPLLIGIAAAIKVNSKGPIFFRQKRHGKDGNLFTILKFRTMHAEKCDPTGVQQTVKGDCRITFIGRFLRHSNFDELPQLVNVLRGEMSLVGPRPHVPGMLAAGVPYEEFDPRYMTRHIVHPGITGLAQVEGYRGETKDPELARKRLEFDLAYIESQSVWLDIKILYKTIIREFLRGNGY